MADIVFNNALARAHELAKLDNTSFGVLLLQATGLEPDSVLRDYDNIQALLASTNTEANFTNYARKVTPETDVTIVVNDTDDRVELDMPDITWTAAGGTLDNTLGKLIIYNDQGVGDVNLVPITAHDFSTTTDGNDLIAKISDFFRAVSAA